jgi:hypothetical protein
MAEDCKLPTSTVTHVAVKLSEFWTSDPELWFDQADSVFRQANETASLTKYDHTLAHLPERLLVSVHDLVRKVRKDKSIKDPYKQLEQQLTASHAKSKWQLAYSLIDHPDLGDRRPSVMMDAKLALLPLEESPGTLFLAHFLRRLPQDTQDQLAALDLDSPAEMAARADKIFDCRAANPSTMSAVNRGRGRGDSLDRHRGRTAGRRPTPGQDQSPDHDPNWCYYHQRFGSRTSKCWPGCTYSGNNQQPAPAN